MPEAELRIEEVHGSATSAAIAILPSHQLRHDQFRVGPLGNRMTVASMGAGHIVVFFESGAGAHFRSLLADSQMSGT